MIYSCFDQDSGHYHYFQDDLQIPVNGDLPVPVLPPIAGKIGVPALQAGRPLPAAAKHVGSGQMARGILVECGRSGSLSGDSTPSGMPPLWKWGVALGLAAAVVYAVHVSTSGEARRA